TCPVPQRFELEGIISFGYDDQVLHIAEMDVPKDLAPGKHEISAAVQWLVCQSSCIPGSADLMLPIEVVSDDVPLTKTPYAPLFDHFAAQHPSNALDIDSFGWDFELSQTAIRPNDTFKAVFRVAAIEGHKIGKHNASVPWPTFTPITGTYWWLNSTEVKNGPDGSILVVMEGESFSPDPDPMPTDDKIGGLFQIEIDGKVVSTEITVGLPWEAEGVDVAKEAGPLLLLANQANGSDTPASADDAAGETPVGEDAAVAGVVPMVSDVTGVALFANLFSAFIGGLILNVMPCVLPVLTLKLYSLIEQTDITAKEQRTAGMGYTGGILASFWLLSGAIVILRLMFGIEVNWGFQFQYPPYVAALATIVFVFGLSLFGVFEIPAFGVGTASEAGSKEGVIGYFFTGVFATLLATPCSAPFLGTAVAFAFGAPTWVLFAIFTMVGLGLAFPFLLIAFVPSLYRFLPKPGAWMDGFKQLLGFTLIATTVWLVGVLGAQIGIDRANGFLAFLLTVSLGAWIFGHFGGIASSGRRQLGALAGALVVSGAGGMYFLDMAFAEDESCDSGEVITDLSFHEEIPWQPFSGERIKTLAGTTILVDFTADWCLTCKVNEKTILNTKAVRQSMDELGVVPLKADWTRRNPEITEWLRRHGRAGVPMYLILPKDGSKAPIVLPEIITQGMVIDAMKEGSS
ncbi:MAG: hypothetical protein GWP91_19030, partial [Rhodobacterales bacterium]|nr:hypothetical protein [Rhodobacterales bacterium]